MDLVKPGSTNTKQPRSIPNDNPCMWDLVFADMVERDLLGEKKHGVRLQPFNGRDVLIDAYQEALDLVVYLRQCIYERDAGVITMKYPGIGTIDYMKLNGWRRIPDA